MGGNHSKSSRGSSVKSKSKRRASTNVDTGRRRSSTKMAPTVEAVACTVNDLKDGDTMEVKLGDATALLVRDKGAYYAVGNKCTHYAAPLSKGSYCNGVVRCPWHGACFNVKTGDIEDFPGLDSLPVYQVEVKGQDVVVKADPDALKSHKRVKAMCRADPANKTKFVIIGGGAAGAACVEALRQEGFTGQILVLSREAALPYDRPKLSKAMSSTAESLALRNADFYSSHDINVRTGAEVTSVDTGKKTVTLSGGESVSYDNLLIATGGRPRTVPIPGADLENVCVLRTPDDANRIAERAKGKKVVIIGSSFIGLEVAVSLTGKAGEVTVVSSSKTAIQNVFGLQIGKVVTKLHEDKGVKFYFERGIKEFTGENGKLKTAVLNDGTSLEADLCVLGIGVVPATDFLKDSGIQMNQRGFITVDKHMKTNIDGVFAAGDIVEFPLFLNADAHSNVQHWQMAHQHGRIAGLTMAGKQAAIRSVPYFWTVMYGKSIRYTGYGPGYDDVVVHGDLSAPQFAAFYTKGDKVVAVASLAFDPIVSQAASLMERGQTIMKAEIMEDPKSWVGRLKQC